MSYGNKDLSSIPRSLARKATLVVLVILVAGEVETDRGLSLSASQPRLAEESQGPVRELVSKKERKVNVF